MTNELEHAGIKGMKWGVRRYQNPDGSLTPAGKKRYATSSIKTRVIRGHAGPGHYVGTRERQLKKYQQDLDYLDKGGHLSLGLTKKRQEQYDKRDRALIETKIKTLRDPNSYREARKKRAERHLKTIGGAMVTSALVGAAVEAGKRVVKRVRG